MRTTLTRSSLATPTPEPDVAARQAKPRFETPTYSTGPCALPNLDDVSEVLAFAEGEDFRLV
jgi:hypothetical protein